MEYELERKRVKNIYLRIRPDYSVYVSANNGVFQSAIEAFLSKKASYILNALDSRTGKNVSKYLKTAAIYHCTERGLKL